MATVAAVLVFLELLVAINAIVQSRVPFRQSSRQNGFETYLFFTLLLGFVAWFLFRSGRSPMTREARGAVRGTVRGFQTRSEGGGSRAIDRAPLAPRTVWTWTLTGTDEDGNPLPPVAVQMRGRNINGFVLDGHDVEVFQRTQRGGLLEPSRVYNHTTGSWVTARG